VFERALLELEGQPQMEPFGKREVPPGVFAMALESGRVVGARKSRNIGKPEHQILR
jgi:hypothetical protein